MSPTATAHKRRRRALEADRIAGRVLEPPYPTSGTHGFRNRTRAELYSLAEYYSWEARKGVTSPCGNDPRNGRPWRRFDPLALAIARAENRAASRVVFELAGAYPNPLP